MSVFAVLDEEQYDYYARFPRCSMARFFCFAMPVAGVGCIYRIESIIYWAAASDFRRWSLYRSRSWRQVVHGRNK
jgi:hypothetical protein